MDELLPGSLLTNPQEKMTVEYLLSSCLVLVYIYMACMESFWCLYSELNRIVERNVYFSG